MRVLVRQHRHDAPLVEQDVADALVREEERAVSVLQLLARVESPGLSLAKRSLIISESSETFSVPSPIGTWRLEGAWRGEI